MNAREKTRTAWRNMKHRCHNPKHHDFYLYGGRGIKVCARWRNSFAAFLADMGEAPHGKSLDRINNDRGYSKANCRWASDYEQRRNTRRNRMITFGGKTLCRTDWERKLGLGDGTLFLRLKRGAPLKDALRPILLALNVNAKETP